MAGFLLISFIAGLLTALAPCVLPLLPVIIGGSVAGEASARKAFVIVSSLGLSVFLFTLILKASTVLINVPPVFWQWLSGGLLLLFGIVTLFPLLWDRIPGVSALYRHSNQMLGAGYQKQSILGDVIVGAALGPVFSSCSPTYFIILAAVLPAHVSIGIAYLIAYIAGLSFALFAIAYLGQRAALRLGFATETGGWFKRVVGVLFIVIGFVVLSGYDKQLEASLPASAFSELGIEQQLLRASQEGRFSPTASSSTQTPGIYLSIAQKAQQYPLAPELVHPDAYINTGGQPITLAQYRGKNVVLVDFWDYSCINCERTFPYLKAWYEKYKDQGLVIVGVHTPEFAFEQLPANVQAAAERFGLTYPIVLDNEYQTWNAFQNQFWPREYLIDIDGYIVHDHAGEGEYDETERVIQAALAERAKRLGTGIVVSSSTVDAASSPDLSDIGSPETYFGSDRNDYLGNGQRGKEGVQSLQVPAAISPNMLYLGGSWNMHSEYAEAGPGATIVYRYDSRDVYMVAANAGNETRLKITRDDKPLGTLAGADVDPKTGEAIISADRLYTLIHDTAPGIHTLKIEIIEGTLNAYTFTFG